MTRLCLDTSAYSRFRRGDAAVTDLLDRAVWIGVPSIVIGELRAGFLMGARFERNEAELVEFLAHPVVEEIPVDAEVARYYAEIIRDLRQAGTPIPTNDIWIAASAAQAGAPILTFDAHFAQIRRVASVLL